MPVGARSAYPLGVLLSVAALAWLGWWTPPATANPTSPPDHPRGSLRNPVEGSWQPTLLPPNDLADPPVNYPGSPGGTCVGMSAVVYALWCSPVQQGQLPLADTASRIIQTLRPDERGRFRNVPLPSRILVGARSLPLESQGALVALAEAVQNRLQPGGGLPKTPAQVRRLHAELTGHRLRIRSEQELRRQVEQAGGRMVTILTDFNPDLTRIEGHAVVLSLDGDGRLSVWDPNARMAGDALGSGRPAPLQVVSDASGRLVRIEYQVDLPDGEARRRTFHYVLPPEVLVPQP